MMPDYMIIGADIGTTGCRAVIYRADGTVLASRTRDYPLHTPQTGWAEQDAEELYQSFLAAVREALTAAAPGPQAAVSMCLSTYFHSVMPVDAEGRPLYRMLIWADTRGQKYLDEVRERLDCRAMCARTGCMLSPQYPLTKILWFRRERPDIFRRAAKFISIKEYVLFRLLGRFAVDRSLASATGLYDSVALRWDPEVLELVGISPDKLSPVFPTTHVVSGLTPEAAAALGVPPSLPVVLGAGDGVLSNLGSGCVRPGQLTAMIGTSGAVRVVRERRYVHPQARTWCYNLTDSHWVTGVAMNSGGLALRWLRDKLGDAERQLAGSEGKDAYDMLTALAGQAPPGADGLLALPFLAGERAPLWSSVSRGVFFGLTMNHGRAHMVRALLEGVIFCLYGIFRTVEEASGRADDIRASGSFTRSPLWVQITADIFGQTVRVPSEPSGSAYGAAILGLYAQGLLPSLDAAGEMVRIAAAFEPQPANHRLYQDYYPLFEALCDKLAPDFAMITELERRSREQ